MGHQRYSTPTDMVLKGISLGFGFATFRMKRTKMNTEGEPHWRPRVHEEYLWVMEVYYEF